MPLARKTFAGRQKHNAGERIPTDKKPARWAMGRQLSLTERSLCTSARHADGCLFAVRVCRGTVNPTYHRCVITVTSQTPAQQSTGCPRGRGDRLIIVILVLLTLLLRRVGPVHRTICKTRLKSYAFFWDCESLAVKMKALLVRCQHEIVPIRFFLRGPKALADARNAERAKGNS